ncbi:hypothetical protein STEG23_025981 [Scotinomys teguina]
MCRNKRVQVNEQYSPTQKIPKAPELKDGHMRLPFQQEDMEARPTAHSAPISLWSGELAPSALESYCTSVLKKHYRYEKMNEKGSI